MRLVLLVLAAFLPQAALTQVSYPPATAQAAQAATDAAAAKAQAAAAQAKADAAQAKADAATAAVSNAVRTVNGVAPTNGAVTLSIPTPADMTGYAKSGDVNSAMAQATAGLATTASVNQAISAALAGTVKSINGLAPNASGAVTLAVPSVPDLTPYALKAQLPAMPDLTGYAKTADVTSTVAAATSGLATTSALSSVQSTVMAAIPKAATNTPRSEVVGAALGSSTRYALEDHQHPRLTSTTYATLDGSGQATVTFSRAFVNKPGLNLTETDAATGAQPLVLRGIGWVQDSNGLYTGVVIQGRRAQMLPTINPLAGTLTLVSGVVTGVNNFTAQLTNYNIFAGSASGATVSVIAVARSDVPSN